MNALKILINFELSVEHLLRGHCDKRPPPLERPFDNVNVHINVLISTLDERPPILKATFLVQKGWPPKRGSTVQRLNSKYNTLVLGQAYGSSVDWAYSVAGIKYAFGIELRDSGQNGLLLHPKSIVPNGEESFEAVKKIAQFLP